ncbi:MAG: hypothetical protein ACI9ZH_000530 [Paracoccaceae bacterium]|jgi:hypothetical protein
MSMSLGATALAPMVPPSPPPSHDQRIAAAGGVIGPASTPGERMAATLKVENPKHAVRVIDERFLRAMLESNDLAVRNPVTGAPRSATTVENRPTGRKDGPDGLAEFRGFELQRDQQQRGDQLRWQRGAETRAIAGGPVAAGFDMRA